MAKSSLRKVGGSVMMTVPPAILEEFDLRPGSTVDLVVEGERIIVEPHRKPRYTMDALLAECKEGASISDEDRDWLNSAPAGRELL
jgi:antitoxin ChpS